MWKDMKWNMLLSAALYAVWGIILIIFPDMTARVICYMLAGIAVVSGVVNVVAYFSRSAAENYYRNEFVTGLVLILLGAFALYKADMLISLIPFLIGLCIMISGLFKLQSALDVHRMGGSAVSILVMALVNVALGVLMLANPFESAMLLYRLLGVCLLYSGLSDLWTTLYVSRKIRSHIKKINDNEDLIL